MPDPVTHLETPEEVKKRRQADSKRTAAVIAEAEEARAAARATMVEDREAAEAEMADEQTALSEADTEASRTEEMTKAVEEAEVEPDVRGVDAIDPSVAAAQVIREEHSRAGQAPPVPTRVNTSVNERGTVTQEIGG